MHLVLVTPGAIPMHVDGRIQLTEKFALGVALFQRYWPGDVTVLAQSALGGVDNNVGSLWRDRTDLDFALVLADDESSALSTLKPDVVMSPLKMKTTNLSVHLDRMVVVAENPVAERMRYDWSERPNRRPPFRQWAGALRQERALRELTRASAGLQCNGFPAWNAYSKLSPLSTLFFDNRIPAETLARSAGSRGRADGPLRMAFSGQLMRHKGPEYAVRLANRLEALGVPASLAILGTGVLDRELRSMAGPNVEFLGALTFDPDWMDYVRSNIDVMVLPHVQGDPSGTYLECAGIGIPILGFDNTALRGLVTDAKLGWTVKMRDEDALLSQACVLAADRTQLAERGAAGLGFMRDHSMEHEFAQRTEHLLAAAGNRGRMRRSAPG